MTKKNIIVTGSKGQLGSEFKYFEKYFSQYNWIFTDRESLDLNNEDEVKVFFAKNRPDFCINCAAYTAVDKAESEEEIATQVNAIAVSNLAIGCMINNCFLIHFSTDYVYHHYTGFPFLESDETHPKGIYAKTKLLGENIIQKLQPLSYAIIRTSWVYGTFGHNFFKTMLRLKNEKKAVKVVYDQIGTPTYTADIVKTTLGIIDFNLNNKEVEISGIYNFSNEGVCSWYDFARDIFSYQNKEYSVTPILSQEFPTAVERPLYSVMNKGKIKSTFNIDIPHWKDSLQDCFDRMNEQ